MVGALLGTKLICCRIVHDGFIIDDTLVFTEIMVVDLVHGLLVFAFYNLLLLFLVKKFEVKSVCKTVIGF